MAHSAPTLTTLVTFNGTNGAGPDSGNLLLDQSGNLYGTTTSGGASGNGTVFKITAGTNTVSTLISFNGNNGTDPVGGLVADASGNLFGTTNLGGSNGYGTVFKIGAGTNTLSTLVNFSSNFIDGSEPKGTMIADSSGNLFGTTDFGGLNGTGTVFKISASSNKLSTLASFTVANGQHPMGGVIEDAQGYLYATTSAGGSSNEGTVFKIDSVTNALTTLASFNGSNGREPMAGLTADAAGNLYGTTFEGGSNDNGTIFEIAAGTHAITTLATFNGSNGANPYGAVIVDAAGNLYGTAQAGPGPAYEGVVFEVRARTNTLSTLFAFDASTGVFPLSGLIADPSGNLYGTTSGGPTQQGPTGHGTVFELTSTGFVVPEPSSLALAFVGSLTLLHRGCRTTKTARMGRLCC